MFRVYAYCLMTNHVHLMIDANGADISQIIHDINFKYAQYFNRIHKRRGHLFQDRFKSKMVKSEGYLFALSAYIHNNPTDIKGYEKRPEKYFFSSLSIYLGLRKDPFELIDDGFVLSLFGNTPKTARLRYMHFVLKCGREAELRDIEFKEEGTEYRSHRTILIRNFNVDDAVKFVSEKMGIPTIKLHLKSCKDMVIPKALISLIMRSLCNAKCSDICRMLGNITQSRVSGLCRIGIDLISRQEIYRGLVEEFIRCYA